jgi:hypothetical protein
VGLHRAGAGEVGVFATAGVADFRIYRLGVREFRDRDN